MADILPGYSYSKSASRYRSSATGQFVSRRQIVGLLNAQVASTEQLFTDLTTAVHERRMSPTAYVAQMRNEVRRQVLAQEALGSGGFDRLGPKQYGRAGRDLRDIYARISGTAQDIAEGKISLPQALARANEYAGTARSHFYSAERENVQRSSSSVIVIERRFLGGGKHCADCMGFYNQGWSLIGVLPVPGTDSVCRGNCKCRFERREVPASEVGDWLGTMR